MVREITRFEDLECWQEARTLARIIYQLTKGPRFDQDRELRWQLRAAAVSPMSNIAEAHGRYSFEDKRRFFDIALGSCKEVQSELYVAFDQGYINEEEFREAYEQGERVARLVAGSLANLGRQIAARPVQRARSGAGPNRRTAVRSNRGTSELPNARTAEPPNFFER